MPFEAEPPNGDYAAYIDKLVNQGTGPPGEQRLLKSSSGLASPIGTPRAPKEMLGPGEQYDPGTGIPSAPTAPAAPSSHFPAGINQPTATPGATLATHSKDFFTGLVQAGFGVLFLFLSLVSIISAFNSPDPLDPGNIVRVVVSLIVGRFLLSRGIRKLRKAPNAVLASLPPFVPARFPKQKN